MKSTPSARRRPCAPGPFPALLWVALALAAPLRAEEAGTDSPRASTRPVVIAPQYKASAFHRWLWWREGRGAFYARAGFSF